MEVTFSEVMGMEELNDGRPRKVKNCKVSRYKNALDVSVCTDVQPRGLERACIPAALTLLQHVSTLRML